MCEEWAAGELWTTWGRSHITQRCCLCLLTAGQLAHVSSACFKLHSTSADGGSWGTCPFGPNSEQHLGRPGLNSHIGKLRSDYISHHPRGAHHFPLLSGRFLGFAAGAAGWARGCAAAFCLMRKIRWLIFFKLRFVFQTSGLCLCFTEFSHTKFLLF